MSYTLQRLRWKQAWRVYQAVPRQDLPRALQQLPKLMELHLSSLQLGSLMPTRGGPEGRRGRLKGKNMVVVGGLEHEYYFSIQLGTIIPTSQLTFIFFRGVGIPPTSGKNVGVEEDFGLIFKILTSPDSFKTKGLKNWGSNTWGKPGMARKRSSERPTALQEAAVFLPTRDSWWCDTQLFQLGIEKALISNHGLESSTWGFSKIT